MSGFFIEDDGVTRLGARDGESRFSRPEALPCLSNNNSDKAEVDEVDFDSVKWDFSYLRKAAFSLAVNVQKFVESYGLDQVGFLTITFDTSVKDFRESQRRFNNFARRILAELFGDRIKVLEPHRDGRPHYHLLVQCHGDIRTGFNWEHYDATREHYRRGGTRAGAPKGDLGRTELLKMLHKRLNEAAPKYGVGRIELTPIRTVAEAVGRYVGGYISKGALYRDKRYKGARWVAYSRGFSRAVKGQFAWVEEGRKWRMKVATWARKHSLASLEEIKAVFGVRWAYHQRESIAQTEPDPTALQPARTMPAEVSKGDRVYRLKSREETREERERRVAQMARSVRRLLFEKQFFPKTAYPLKAQSAERRSRPNRYKSE